MGEPKIPSENEIAEIQLSYCPIIKSSQLPSVSTATDAYNLFLQTWDIEKLEFVEQFKVMILNKANRVLGICSLSTGSATKTIVDPRLIFFLALKTNATGIILAHNHPSGNIKPSRNDMEMTEKLEKIGEYLDVRVIDHLIISSEAYYSFAQEGTL